MARTILVTRHAAARRWIQAQGWHVDEEQAHLEVASVEPGDRIVGTLPMHLAAAVCERGARYFHLALDVPAAWRGRELSDGQMAGCNARLEEYVVRRGEAWA